jgi:hypothetical protein
MVWQKYKSASMDQWFNVRPEPITSMPRSIRGGPRLRFQRRQRLFFHHSGRCRNLTLAYMAFGDVQWLRVLRSWSVQRPMEDSKTVKDKENEKFESHDLTRAEIWTPR